METAEEIQSVLELFWADPRVTQRVAQQIHSASLSIYQITKNYFYLERTIVVGKSHSNPPTLLIALGKAFPLSAPMTLLKAGLPNSLKDYQDLTALALGQEWQHNKHTLTMLIERARQFLNELDLDKSNAAKRGRYHTQRLYDYPILKDLAILSPFICFEQLQDSVKLFVVALTNTHFLLFRPSHQPIYCKQVLTVPKEAELCGMNLVFVAELQSLRQVQFDRSSRNQYSLTFATMRMQQGQLNKVTYQKSLHITRSYEFIDELVKRMKELDMLIDLTLGSKTDEAEREMMLETRLSEERLDRYLNRKTIFELNDSYQRMIEHYSMTDLPYQEIFISKINALSQRPQVKFILEAGSEVTS